MREHIKKINELSLPVTILIASFVLGGFYYASEANKTASIERQQQVELEAKEATQAADLQAKADAQAAAAEQNTRIANAKAACVKSAENIAISMYNNSYSCTGSYPESDCFTGTYLVPQYNNAYSICLQGKGLK